MSFRFPRTPLSKVRSPVESGCKDTTIFQTAKIFFHVFFMFSLRTLYISHLRNEFFFGKKKITPGTRRKNAFSVRIFGKIGRWTTGKNAISSQVVVYHRCYIVSAWQGNYTTHCASTFCFHQAAAPWRAGRLSDTSRPSLPPSFPLCKWENDGRTMGERWENDGTTGGNRTGTGNWNFTALLLQHVSLSLLTLLLII